MNQPLYYISTLRPKRPSFLATMTPEEQRVMGEHMAYTKLLFEEGKIVLGGTATDGAIGVIIWKLSSAEEGRHIFDNDPAVKAGIGEAELHPFRIGLFGGK